MRLENNNGIHTGIQATKKLIAGIVFVQRIPVEVKGEMIRVLLHLKNIFPKSNRKQQSAFRRGDI